MTKDAHSISIKLWLPLLVSGLAITLWAMMTWQEYSSLRTNLIDSSKHFIQLDMDRLQYQLETEFRRGHENEAEQAITSRGVFNHYASLVLIDEQQRVLYSTRFTQRGQLAKKVLADFDNDRFETLSIQKRADIRLDEDRDRYTVYYPVILPRQAGDIRSLHTGALFLVYDFSSDLQAIWYRLLQTSLLIAVILLFAVILFLIFAHRYIKRPITHLIDAAHEISEGNYEISSHIVGHGELAQLGKAFNKMSNQLRLNSQQRDKAEATIRESEHNYRSLFENSEVAIYNEDMSTVYATLQQLREQGITDLAHYLQDNPDAVWEMIAQVRVINVNQAALELYAASKESEFIQQIEKTFGEGAIDIFIDELCAIWDGVSSFSAEANFISLDGNAINAIVSFPIPDNAEDFYSIPVSIIDVTKRKQAEDALRRVQKMEAIGQLTGGIAHDFNNILGIIIGNLGLLEQQNALEEKARKRIDTIKRSTQRATNLTRQLLGFSSQQRKPTKPVNINKMIHDNRNLISQSLTPQIEAEYHCAEDICLTEINSGDFEDALLNLVLNARDAMLGRGKLSIETRNCELDEGYSKLNSGVTPGQYVQLSISDDGSGIQQEQLDRIFEPFYTTKEQDKGTGLGLSMVFGFIKRSAGHIKVYSEYGIGTTFRIYLPCSDNRIVADVDNTEQAEDLPRGQETILVVDDEPDLLELVATTLHEQGYQVITAVDGNDALLKLKQHTPVHLLFSDVVMPGGINGYELADMAVKKYPGLKVLLTSGYTEKAVARNGQARFNANLLSKPYTQVELVKQIHDTLVSN